MAGASVSTVLAGSVAHVAASAADGSRFSYPECSVSSSLRAVSEHGFGQLFEQPVRAVNDKPCSRANRTQPPQRHPFRTGTGGLLFPSHAIECRGHHATLPRPQTRALAGNTVRSTAPPEPTVRDVFVLGLVVLVGVEVSSRMSVRWWRR
jgi:hypothetical protein